MRAKDTVTPIRAGRPSLDPKWAAIIATAPELLPDDPDETEALNEIAHRDQILPRGCVLRPSARGKGRELDSVWLCYQSINGTRRLIGKGTLFQCARLWDASLIYFDAYRKRGKVDGLFNFSQDTAKADLLLEPDLVAYLDALKALLLERGLMPQRTDRAEQAKLNCATRRHSETVTAKVAELIGRFDALLVEVSRLVKHAHSHDLSLCALREAIEELTQQVKTNAAVSLERLMEKERRDAELRALAKLDLHSNVSADQGGCYPIPKPLFEYGPTPTDPDFHGS
jgi:hypothetical protein